MRQNEPYLHLRKLARLTRMLTELIIRDNRHITIRYIPLILDISIGSVDSIISKVLRPRKVYV